MSERPRRRRQGSSSTPFRAARLLRRSSAGACPARQLDALLASDDEMRDVDASQIRARGPPTATANVPLREGDEPLLRPSSTAVAAALAAAPIVTLPAVAQAASISSESFVCRE